VSAEPHTNDTDYTNIRKPVDAASADFQNEEFALDFGAKISKSRLFIRLTFYVVFSAKNQATWQTATLVPEDNRNAQDFAHELPPPGVHRRQVGLHCDFLFGLIFESTRAIESIETAWKIIFK
jgi:hypothetical protein